MKKETQDALGKLRMVLSNMYRTEQWQLETQEGLRLTQDNIGKEDVARVIKALDALPDVESIAMNGGWVLDCGNIWCKSGDNVLFHATASSEQQSGVLEFSTDTFAWEITHGSAIIPLGDVYEWHKL